MKHTLLLFSNDAPCWDQETFVLAGENLDSIGYLLSEEYIEECQDGFVLTHKGVRAREDMAKELYVSADKITTFDAREALWNNRLYLLTDKAFVGRFGLKEFTLKEKFEVLPYLPSSNLYEYDGSNLEYIWQKNPIIRSLLEKFPNPGKCREFTPPSLSMFQNWVSANKAQKGTLSVELMLRNRYDFELYRNDPELTNDIFRIKNADRFFFMKAQTDNIEDLATRIGLLHIFMLTQRHVYIPGYVDFDSQMQENWTVVVLVADNEDEVVKLYDSFSPFEQQLITPAAPMYVIATSIERLRQVKKPKETVYDWFCEETTHIARADVPLTYVKKN